MTNSMDLAKRFNKRHYNLIKTIKQYKDRFERFGELKVEKIIYGKGRPILNYQLNEQQVSLLLMLLGNNKEVLDYKDEFMKKFIEVREKYLALTEEN